MKQFKYPFLLLLISSATCYATFDTLSQLEAFAQKKPEILPGQYDWINPDFSAYHRQENQILPSLYRFFTQKNDVAYLLTKNLDAYLQTKKGNTHDIVNLQTDDAQLFIWGDMHGAFHSLIRCLVELRRQNIIDEQLQIINQNHFFVFNGDAISRSAYNLETLNLIVQLMLKNPDNIFYIRGKLELNNYWRNFNLKQEVHIRGKHLQNNGNSLSQQISTFFEQLPLALFIQTTTNPNKQIRISHFSRFSEIVPEEKNKDVQVVITSEDWRNSQRNKNGLALLDQDLGAIAWNVFSSPTQIHQTYAQFFYDAFAQIKIGKTIKETTIALINHDIQKRNAPFVYHEPRNILTGMEAHNPTSIPQKKDIKLGSSMSLIQGVPIMGEQTKRGLMVKINQENTMHGGINGQLLRVVIKNDDYNPAKARQNIKSYIQNDIDIIISPVGSPTLSSYLDLIREDKILALFPITGGSLFRGKDYNNIIHFRTTYDAEVRALIDYMVKETGSQNIAIFYQNDSYGIGPRDAAHKALEQHGITQWLDVPYLRASANLTKQAEQITQAQPDTIALFSAAQPTQELIRQIGIDKITNKKLFGISFLGEESFRRFNKKHGIEVTFGAVVPNPNKSDLEIVKEYREQMDKNNYPYDVFSLESYITTSILIEVMKQINGPITKNSVKAQLQSLNNFAFKGLTLTYNPERNDLSQDVYLETSPDKPWIKKSID